jgi:ribosome-associated translation inhibitor RaiA
LDRNFGNGNTYLSFLKGGKKMYIFISYSFKDSQFAKLLANEVKKMGFQVFIGDQEIEAGDSIPQAIGEAINNCDYFIIILSPDSIDSSWVKREIDIEMMRKNITVVPVLYKECKIQPLLTPILHIDITGETEAKAIENVVEKLASQMSKLKSKPSQTYETQPKKPLNLNPPEKPGQNINIIGNQIKGGTINFANEIKINNDKKYTGE